MKTIFRVMLLLCAAVGSAQQTYTPWDGAPMVQFSDANGNPLAGGKLYSYIAGSTTPKATYQDTIGTVNSNPVILDSAGEAKVWLAAGGYKFILKDSSDVILRTVDNVILSTGTGFPCSSMPIFTGDVSNTQCAVTVIGLRGRTVANTAPNDLQYLGWNAGGSQWEPKTLAATSVALSAPSSIFSVSGSPGASLGLNYATGQTANRVYGTDGAGAAGLMSLTAAQLPWTVSGNTTVVCSVSGALTAGHALKIDASGNCVDGGAGSGSIVQGVSITGCTTGSGTGDTCGPIVADWPVPFADTSYFVACSIVDPSPGLNLSGGSTTMAQFYVTTHTTTTVGGYYETLRGAATTATAIYCVGMHP